MQHRKYLGLGVVVVVVGGGGGGGGRGRHGCALSSAPTGQTHNFSIGRHKTLKTTNTIPCHFKLCNGIIS